MAGASCLLGARNCIVAGGRAQGSIEAILSDRNRSQDQWDATLGVPRRDSAITCARECIKSATSGKILKRMKHRLCSKKARQDRLFHSEKRLKSLALHSF